MRTLAILFVISLVFSGTSAACSATAVCGLLNPTCILSNIINGAGCLLNELPSLDLTLVDGTLTQTLTQNLASITLNANGNSFLQLNVAANVNVLGTITVNGNTLLQIGQGIVMVVNGTITIAQGSVLKVLGNLVSPLAVSVYGTLQLAGSVSNNKTQTAWLTAPTVYLAGLPAAIGGDAYLRGNGGIHGDVICREYVTLSAGNSPGTIYIWGNLVMNSNNNVIIDVVSASSFDVYIVELSLTRGNARATLNFDGFTPSSTDRLIFMTHSNASGYFSSITGNISPLVMVFGATSTSTIYDDATVSSYCSSTCTAIPVEPEY